MEIEFKKLEKKIMAIDDEQREYNQYLTESLKQKTKPI